MFTNIDEYSVEFVEFASVKLNLHQLIGRAKENVEPWPSCESTQILPP